MMMMDDDDHNRWWWWVMMMMDDDDNGGGWWWPFKLNLILDHKKVFPCFLCLKYWKEISFAILSISYFSRFDICILF